MRTALILSILVVVTGGCGGTPHPAPVVPDPWQRLELPGAGALYLYPEPIERYAPDDRGAYVVGVAADAADLRASLGPTDDIVGVDAFVVRLSAAERDALAGRAGVTGLTILQPAARRAPEPPSRGAAATAGPVEVRVDLFADAAAGEVTAIAAWIEERGGHVRWKGRSALRADVPLAAIVDASRLSPVRWIE